MSAGDTWTIHFDREGRPVGVSGPSLPVPEGGRPGGMAVMEVVPLAPLQRECAGPGEAALKVLRDGLEDAADVRRIDWPRLRELAHEAAAAGLRWRREFSRSARDAEDTWGVR